MKLAKVRKERLLVGEKVAATVERTMVCLLIQHDSRRLLALAELLITTLFYSVRILARGVGRLPDCAATDYWGLAGAMNISPP